MARSRNTAARSSLNLPLPPLVVAVLFFLAGILASLRFEPPPLPLLLAAAGLLAFAWRAYHDPRRSPRADLLILLAFAATGAALGAARVGPEDCREAIPNRTTVEVEGVLGAGVFPAEISEGPPLLPLEQARMRAPGWECIAPVRAILPGATPAALAGSRVSFRAMWIRGTRHAAVGAWPIDGYRAGYLRAGQVTAIEPARLHEHPLLTLRGLTERHLHELFPRHFAMVEALLLGRRERLDPAVRDRFALAGLSHLLAISGSHVALLAGVLLVVGGAIRMPRRRITWSTILLVCVYLALIGAPASAVRAGAMVSLALLALLLQRPSAALPIAAAAGLFIVALDPLAVLDVGLQLSFAGVFGIVAAQRTVGRRLASVTRGKPWHWMTETLLISAAAFLSTAPITAYQFGTIAPIAILANLPAIPLTGLSLVGVLAAAVAAPIRPLADLLASGAGLALDLLDAVASVAASAPYGNAAVHRSHLLAWLGAAAAGALMAALIRRARFAVRAAVAVGGGAAALIAWPLVAAVPAPGLEIHFLDVGQGDAVALRTPRGRWLLVDAGPRGVEYDAGERRVVPFFRARGVGRLEALILTHPDADHIGGAPAVLRSLRVERVIEPGVAVGKELYLEMLEQVEAGETTWVAARSGRTLRLDGVELWFLWPDAAMVNGAVEANEASAIAIVRYGDFALVLPGDASAAVEAELVRRHGAALRASVLKAGHHGSSTSTSAEFLQAVDPALVVISAGRDNRYGHPARDVLARLRAADVEIARTDLEGTISLRVSGEGGSHAIRIGQ